MKKAVLVLALLAVAGAFIMADGYTDGRLKLWKLGFSTLPAPTDAAEFSAEKLSGGAVKLSSLRGKVVVLNFWATWCPPCKAEMPSIQKLSESFGGLPVEIVAISLKEPKATVERFIKNMKYTYPIYLDVSGEIGKKYNINSIPTTIIIDPFGKIVAKRVGDYDYAAPEFLDALKTGAGK